MALLRDLDAKKDVTTHVSLQVRQELLRSMQQLLNGENYIQVIGSPAIYYDLVAYVNPAGLQKLLTAEARMNLLQVVVRAGTYTGRITEMKLSERLAGDWKEAQITLAKE